MNIQKLDQEAHSSNTIKNHHEYVNWSYERYRSAIAQRNVMTLINIIAIVAIILSSTAVTKITREKTLDPFIIEVDSKSGIVTILDQEKIKIYTSNDAMNRFFINKYLRARELFDTKNYRYLYYRESRLLSTENVYRGFTSLLRSNSSLNPMQAYANNIDCNLEIRSFQYLTTPPNTVQVRFTVTYTTKSGRMNTKHKVAILSFEYLPMKLSEQERYINPLGFAITSYNSSYEVIP